MDRSFLILALLLITASLQLVVGQDALRHEAARHMAASQDATETLAEVYADLLSQLTALWGIKSNLNVAAKLDSFTEAAISFNVSDLCMNHTLVYLDDLMAGQMYALKMFDATAKPPSGIMSANLLWTGQYEQCLEVTSANKSIEEDFGAQYCMTAVQGIELIPAPGQPFPIKYAVCAPDTCSSDDVMGLLNSVLSLIPMQKPLSIGVVECNTDVVPYTAGDITAIIICAIVLFMALVGTAYDYYDRYRQEMIKAYINGDVISDLGTGQMSDGSLAPHSGDDEKLITFQRSREQSRQTSLLQKICLSFSVVKNADKLFDISNTQREIQVLHGIRVLSLWWVILGHCHLFYILNYDNLGQVLTTLKRWTFQAIGNATFSVDTFFFLSGLLVTFLALKYMRQNNGAMRWGMFYLHRYLRLTPVYAFCMLFFTTLTLHLPRTPQAQELLAGNTCTQYWWANLLYINNFIPLDNAKMCFGWAWYLANDMQFYVISPLFIILLYRSPRVGLAVIGGVIVTSMGVTGFICTYFGQAGLSFGLVPLPPHHLYVNAPGFDYIYGKPYTRISTYLVGMVTGYILFTTECKKDFLKIKPVLVVLGWMCAWAVALAVVYGFAKDIHDGVKLTQDLLSFYNAVSRFCWSVCLAWVVVACVHGYGGPITQILEWKMWIPLSRLTYCAYLVHPIWMFFHGALRSSSVHYDDLTMIYFYIGDVVLSYGVAMIVSLLVEAPLLAVEKLAMGR